MYLGNVTPSGDFLFRAAQAHVAFLGLGREEAIYLSVSTDINGDLLMGENKYTIHFEPDGQPIVNSFWSITMYNSLYNLVENPIDRYSLGDRSSMMTGPDGSLTMYLHREAPPHKEENWLPTPSEGRFLLILRAYLPGYEMVGQRWKRQLWNWFIKRAIEEDYLHLPVVGGGIS
ncbi:hypothetical protein FGB62_157g027 [Gracilaria domingensis]|nr:hypothetical protein FGB62_157g027 [Gracilaria domingensis]